MVGKILHRKTGDYLFPWHLQHIDAAVQRLLTDPTFNRLLVQVPVRHGKSYYADLCLPIDYILKNPRKKFVLATHTAAFSADWTGRIRDFVKEFGPALTGVGLDRECQARNFWRTSEGGECRGVAPGGACAGVGGDLIVFDDLISQQADAGSALQRQSLQTWFYGELMTRLMPGGKVLGIMSARHPEDIMQHLLSTNADLKPHERWHLIKFPAINDKGEALWPGMWPLYRLLEEKHKLEITDQAYLWEALYQQNPIGDPRYLEWPTSYFEGIWYTGTRASQDGRLMRVMAMDPSVGRDSRTADYPAIVVLDYYRDGSLWVPESFMRQVPIEAAEDQAVAMIIEHKPRAFIVESNGFQELVAKNIIRKLQSACPEALMRTEICIKNNTIPKEVRIRMQLGPLLCNHQLRLRDCIDNQTGYRQMQAFPTSEHDDYCDALSLGVTLLVDKLKNL